MSKAGSADLAALKHSIRSIEHGGYDVTKAKPISLDTATIDAALPWGGLARAGLHEISGIGNPEFGFHAGLLRRTADESGLVLWCRHAGMEHETGLPYGPGLAAFGLVPAQFVFVRARKPADVLWAMEEGLRAGGLAAVVGDGIAPDFTATRRLQLAAESSGTTAFLLPPFSRASKTTPLSAALTRWRIHALPSVGECVGMCWGMCWRIELVRCRGGAPKDWIVEWDEQALRFRLAEALANRAAAG